MNYQCDGGAALSWFWVELFERPNSLCYNWSWRWEGGIVQDVLTDAVSVSRFHPLSWQPCWVCVCVSVSLLPLCLLLIWWTTIILDTATILDFPLYCLYELPGIFSCQSFPQWLHGTWITGVLKALNARRLDRATRKARPHLPPYHYFIVKHGFDPMVPTTTIAALHVQWRS